MREQRSVRIEVTAVAEGCWRVCEASLDDNDAGRLVAFFERDGDGISVVWLRETSSPTRFVSFDDALDAACALVSGRPIVPHGSAAGAPRGRWSPTTFSG